MMSDRKNILSEEKMYRQIEKIQCQKKKMHR